MFKSDLKVYTKWIKSLNKNWKSNYKFPHIYWRKLIGNLKTKIEKRKCFRKNL